MRLFLSILLSGLLGTNISSHISESLFIFICTTPLFSLFLSIVPPKEPYNTKFQLPGKGLLQLQTTVISASINLQLESGITTFRSVAFRSDRLLREKFVILFEDTRKVSVFRDTAL